MDFISQIQIDKLIAEIGMVRMEVRRRNRISDHHEIDDFFYLQKIEELLLLKQQSEIAHKNAQRVNGHLAGNFAEICRALKKDSKFLGLPQTPAICEEPIV